MVKAERKRHSLPPPAIGLLLAAFAIVLYWPVLGHSFIVYDDREYVTTNPHVLGGLNWEAVKWAFTSTEAANWHPLTWISHALDTQLFGLKPAGHHFDSILIHAVSAAVLFWLLAWITKRVEPSLLAAALFAVHPINVESVAWIAERKNVLSTLFFLLAIAAYAWYAQRPGWRRYLVVAAFFAAGLMAKPMVVTLPFVLLLLDYWPFRRIADARSALRYLGEKVPLLLLSACSAWITLIAQRGAVRSLGDFALGMRIENAVAAYGLYVWKMLWPAGLAFYPHAVSALPQWQWMFAGLCLTGVTMLVFAFPEKRYLPVGWLWFLGTLVPVIGLVQVGEASMADRYAYVPLIGLFILISWGLADLANAYRVSVFWRVIPAACILAALCWVSRSQMSYWDSDYHLWSRALAVSENPLTHNALGVLLMNPGSELTHADLAGIGAGPERTRAARRHFERALEMTRSAAQQNSVAYLPDMARSLNNLGNLDRIENLVEQARYHYGGALEIYRELAPRDPAAYLPNLAAALNNAGSMDRLQNWTDEARREYEEALRINRRLAEQNPAKYDPNVAMTLNNLGLLDANQNRMDEAREHYAEALKIDRQLADRSPGVYLSDLATTLNECGLLDAAQNRLEGARQEFEEALNANRRLAAQNPVYLPQMAMTLTSLGRVDRLQNRIDESRQHYQEALRVFHELQQSDRRFAGDAASVEGSLNELERQSHS